MSDVQMHVKDPENLGANFFWQNFSLQKIRVCLPTGIQWASWVFLMWENIFIVRKRCPRKILTSNASFFCLQEKRMWQRTFLEKISPSLLNPFHATQKRQNGKKKLKDLTNSGAPASLRLIAANGEGGNPSPVHLRDNLFSPVFWFTFSLSCFLVLLWKIDQ